MPPKHFTDAQTTNFYYSFLFLPSEKRRAIEAVYHFARRSDDAADEQRSAASATREINQYRAFLDHCYGQSGGQRYEKAGAAQESPALQALAESIRGFRIPREPFDELLRGVEMDIAMDHGAGAYKTFEELELYCYRVASAIGLIAIEIFGYRNPQTREYAVNLGKSLQLVNILRDVDGDFRQGRVYLPQEDLERFGVDAASLAGRRYNDAFIRLMSFECDRALDYFSKARSLLPREDHRSMLPAEIMGAIYWQLMRRIQKRSYNVFGARVRLSRPKKIGTALRVYLGFDWHT
ncbi:MAG: phytoene/squalene synthase family protein [Terriglobia bacterium]